MPRTTTHMKVTIIAVAAMVLSCAQTLHDCVQGLAERNAGVAAAKRTYGAFTESQILDRSRSLFSALLPNRDNLSLVAEKQGDGWRGGAVHRLWNVQCVDEHKSVIASMLLDADTGRAQQVSARLLTDAPRSDASPSISSAAAVAEAEAWVGKLDDHEPWHACKSPVASPATWHIQLSAPGRTALVCLNRRSGSLVYASIAGKFSRYTALQVARGFRPMFRELLSKRSPFIVKVESEQAQLHDGSTQRQWSVACLNDDRSVNARLVQDADTGKIMLFTGEPANEPGSMMKHAPIRLDTAIATAQRCIKLLGYAEERWRVSETSQSQRVWHIQLKADGNTALLTLDKQTGTLLYVSFQKRLDQME